MKWTFSRPPSHREVELIEDVQRRPSKWIDPEMELFGTMFPTGHFLHARERYYPVTKEERRTIHRISQEVQYQYEDGLNSGAGWLFRGCSFVDDYASLPLNWEAFREWKMSALQSDQETP